MGQGLPRWCSGKEPAYQAGGVGLIPGSGRSPGEGTGNPLQYSCLKNPLDRGNWWVMVHQVAKSQTQLSMHACTDTESRLVITLGGGYLGER